MNIREALKTIISVESNLDGRKSILNELGFKGGNGSTVSMIKQHLNNGIRKGIDQDAASYLKQMSDAYKNQRPDNLVKQNKKPNKLSPLEKVQLDIQRLETLISQLEGSK